MAHGRRGAAAREGGSLKLYVVRHARTRWSGVRYCGRADPSLSPAGRLEARAAAAWLAARGDRPSLTISSPSVRAIETARRVAAPRMRTVETDARLREIDFGAVEGLTFVELERRWPELARRVAEGELEIDWPGGERWSDLAARVAEFWRERTGSGAGDATVVTHGGPARCILSLAGAARPAALAPAEIVALERTAAWTAVATWRPEPFARVEGSR